MVGNPRKYLNRVTQESPNDLIYSAAHEASDDPYKVRVLLSVYDCV